MPLLSPPLEVFPSCFLTHPGLGRGLPSEQWGQEQMALTLGRKMGLLSKWGQPGLQVTQLGHQLRPQCSLGGPIVTASSLAST